jgi:hypothetical protein
LISIIALLYIGATSLMPTTKTQAGEPAVYMLAGLRIVSDIPLVGLKICRIEGAHREVVIRRAAIPINLASATATFRDGLWVGKYNGREVLLDFSSAGRFLVRAGEEIVIDPAPSSDADELRAYLLGTVFGVLFHQRGMTPLHASAIDVADGCVAFVGASRAGKSTLVAALIQRGHEVIADDVCFLDLDNSGNVQVWPGIARIRLWEEAICALGCNGPGIEREMHGYNKYFVPVRPLRNPFERRRLHRVYQLHPSSDGVIKVIRLHGLAAVEVLMQNVYRLGLAETLGYKPRVFGVCAAAARSVPVFQFSRPKDFKALEESIEFLEDHLVGERTEELLFSYNPTSMSGD